MRFILAILLLIFSTSHIYAQTTAWVEEPQSKTRMRILLSPPQTHLETHLWQGLIEVELPPQWHTYWRFPGNAGMAPSFTFTPNDHVDIFYPKPHYITTADQDWSIGYEHTVTFPFLITSQKIPTHFTANISIGVCAQLCIPFQESFTLDARQQNDPITAQKIHHAFSDFTNILIADFQLIKLEQKGNEIFLTLMHPNSQTAPLLLLETEDLTLDRPRVVKSTEHETVYASKIIFVPKNKQTNLRFTAYVGNRSYSGIEKLLLKEN